MIRRISNYKLLRKLGEGGMGEVWFAEDERLGRKVALKLLPEANGRTRRNLNRFLQEARLAANLNHPNICTIYEVSETEETPLLAMELVEGETLAEKVRAGGPDIFGILRIATQIADALDEAHEQGVIHRDIKASNIIINRRGQVKILDFGLAKTISGEISEDDITRAKTEDGTLVGTIHYMSPEQALGRELDGRTDLWSLGVLLYELVTGAVPFRAPTQAGIFDEILNKQPVPPEELRADLPPELGRIILKLLEKDAGMRYQTASDLLADLKRLRRSLGESFDSGEMLRPLSSEELRNPAAVHGRRTALPALLTVILGVAVLGGIAFAVYRLMPPADDRFSITGATPTRVTNLGNISDAAVSDDGRYIAYILNEGERQSLWLKQTGNGGTAQVVEPAGVIYQGVRISPDGNWIYYNIWDKKNVGEIYRVPVLGGIPQRVVHDSMPGLTLSPDNERIVFIRSYDETQTSKLISARVDGSDEKVIYQTAPAAGGVFAASYAPDGKTLALIGSFPKDESETYRARIVEMPAEGGELRTIWEGADDTGFASNPQWLPDKSGLLVSLDQGEVTRKLFLISYPDGEQIPINTDLNSYDSLSITADGKNFVGIERDFSLSVWTFAVDRPSDAERVTDGKIEGAGLDWTPDGEIVYSSIVSGLFNIWKMRPDGSEKKQLTNYDFSGVNPCVMQDGRKILFFSNRRGGHLIDIDGRELGDEWKKNVSGYNFGCMRSENALLYYADEEEKKGLIKLDPETGEKTLVLGEIIQQFQISPDGKLLFYTFWDPERRHLASAVLDLRNGEKRPVSLPSSAIDNIGSGSQYNFKWMPDGRSIAYVDHRGSVSNIWIHPLETGRPRQLTNFKDNLIRDFSISHDGKRIAVSRGTISSDVVLFRTNR